MVLEGPHQRPREARTGDGEQEGTAAAGRDHLTWMLSVIHAGADYSLTGAETQSKVVQHQRGSSHSAPASSKKKKKRSIGNTDLFVPKVSIFDEWSCVLEFTIAAFQPLHLEKTDRNRTLIPVPSFSTTRGASLRHTRHGAFAAPERPWRETTHAEKKAGRWWKDFYTSTEVCGLLSLHWRMFCCFSWLAGADSFSTNKVEKL